jgi:hypothetical protein
MAPNDNDLPDVLKRRCPCNKCIPYCPNTLPWFVTDELCSFCKAGLHKQ